MLNAPLSSVPRQPSGAFDVVLLSAHVAAARNNRRRPDVVGMAGPTSSARTAAKEKPSHLRQGLERRPFPGAGTRAGPMGERHAFSVPGLDTVRVDVRFLRRRGHAGRPSGDRSASTRSFVDGAMFEISTTRTSVASACRNEIAPFA